MYTNVGRLDAWIRGALAVGFILVSAIFNAHAVISLAAALVALLLIGTALTRYCPLYRVLRVDTGGHGSATRSA